MAVYSSDVNPPFKLRECHILIDTAYSGGFMHASECIETDGEREWANLLAGGLTMLGRTCSSASPFLLGWITCLFEGKTD